MGRSMSESDEIDNEEKSSVSSLKRSKNDMHIVENIPEEKGSFYDDSNGSLEERDEQSPIMLK